MASKNEEVLLNMDPQTIVAMTDEQLHSYIPAFGDIHAIKRYCKELMKNEQKNQRTESLFKKLRRKMGKEKSSESEEETESDKKNTKKKSKKTQNLFEGNRSEQLLGNKNAKKAERKIEIGWFDYEYADNNYYQVKTPNGGGARDVNALKVWLPHNIIEHGKKLFFRNGKSKRGMVTDFDFEAIDENNLEQEQDEDLPKLSRTTNSRNLQRSISKSTLAGTGDPGTGTPLPDATSTITLTITSDDFFPPENDRFQLLQSLNTAVHILPPLELSRYLESVNETLQPNEQIGETPSVNGLSCSGVPEFSAPLDKKNESSAECDGDSSLPQRGSLPQSNTPGEYEQMLTPGIALPYRDSEDNDTKEELKIVRIHKSNLFSEMINLFKCKVIRVKANGDDELGDGEGLLRDVFFEFWEVLYAKCCDGFDIKVPFLRHDMQQEEWTAVAHILVNGFRTVNYFPVQICQACFEDALFGVPNANLVDACLRFVPNTDKIALEKALNDFEGIDLGELIDVLETYDCKRYPSQDNIKNIIQEIAHKEIIQQPKFVTDCWISAKTSYE